MDYQGAKRNTSIAKQIRSGSKFYSVTVYTWSPESATVAEAEEEVSDSLYKAVNICKQIEKVIMIGYRFSIYNVYYRVNVRLIHTT